MTKAVTSLAWVVKSSFYFYARQDIYRQVFGLSKILEKNNTKHKIQLKINFQSDSEFLLEVNNVFFRAKTKLLSLRVIIASFDPLTNICAAPPPF